MLLTRTQATVHAVALHAAKRRHAAPSKHAHAPVDQNAAESHAIADALAVSKPIQDWLSLRKPVFFYHY